MGAKKGLENFAGMADVQELSEQELDAVVGGAGNAQEIELVIDTTKAQTLEDASKGNDCFKRGDPVKITFDGGKNPFYKENGNNIHLIDLSNLN